MVACPLMSHNRNLTGCASVDSSHSSQFAFLHAVPHCSALMYCRCFPFDYPTITQKLMRVRCAFTRQSPRGFLPSTRRCSTGLPCNVRGVSAVRFTTRSRTHCTRPIRTCTAHPRTVRHTRDNKGYKAHKEKGNQIHRRDHISRVL